MFLLRARQRSTTLPLLLMTLILLGVTACSNTTGTGQNGTQGLQSTLETLRDPWGLFVDPTFYDEQGSVYSTALLDAALGRSARVGADSDTAAKRICASTERQEVGDPWFSWSVAMVFTNPPAGCITATQPKRSADVNTDIPKLFAWVATRIHLGVAPRDLQAVVEPELARVKSSRSAYVMWRADQIEQLLGLPSTASQRPAAAPTTLTGPDDLTELWGFTMRCASDHNCAPSTISDQDVAIAATSFPDDLSLAGAISILSARNSTGFLDVLTSAVTARRIDGTGLVRRSRFVGTIDASFTVLQIAPNLFPGPAPAVTAADLERRLNLIPRTDVVKRIRALAILTVVDPQAAKQHAAEVESVFASYDRAPVSKKDLLGYVNTVAAFGAMSMDAPTAKLQLFKADTDEARYLAKVAAANSADFSNDSQILTTYAAVRRTALKEGGAPVEPIVSWVAGLQSLAGPGIDLSGQQRTAITKAVAQLRGCEIDGHRSEMLYRFTVAEPSACSLTITSAVQLSSFGS